MGETYQKIINASCSYSSNREKQIEKARQIWKSGFVAESIHNFCKNNHFIDTSDRKHKGLLDGDDLANWQAHEEKARSFKYKNYEVFKTDVWGQGPSFLQQLAILDNFDLSKLTEEDYDDVMAKFEEDEDEIDYGVDDTRLQELLGTDKHLDAAIQYYLEMDDDYIDEWDD